MGTRNDITFAESISNVVNSLLVVVPRMHKRRSRMGDVSQAYLSLDVLRPLIAAPEHRWRYDQRRQGRWNSERNPTLVSAAPDPKPEAGEAQF